MKWETTKNMLCKYDGLKLPVECEGFELQREIHKFITWLMEITQPDGLCRLCCRTEEVCGFTSQFVGGK